MDLNRAACYTLLSPFSQGHLSNKVIIQCRRAKFITLHHSPHTNAEHSNPAGSRAICSCLPCSSSRAGFANDFQREEDAPLPLLLHGPCISQEAAQEMHWGIKSHHRALCWFIHCFQQDCRGEPEGSFWLRNGNSGYLFICNDSDGRARGGCSFPSPTLCWLQAGSTQLCPLQHAWLALLCTHLCTEDR